MRFFSIIRTNLSGKRLLPVLCALFLLCSAKSFASEDSSGFNAKDFAMEHVLDSHQWHLVGHVILPLPCIVYHAGDGFHVFSSRNLDNKNIPDTADLSKIKTYKGFYLNESGKIRNTDGRFTLDLSITKSVATLMIDAIILLILFLGAAKGYRKREKMAPKGLQSLMEPLILFIRDDVAKPNLGKLTDRYLPFITTVFFFILIGNLLGLIPLISNPNLTGNIAVTGCLAIMTFLLTNLHANKYYWKHIFWPPDVPLAVKIILVPIEIIGVFTKPFALMIRLFANITAGHIVGVSLIALIFIFSHAGDKLGAGLGSSLVAVPFALFMSFIEILVAFLQAYIFALLSALFISLAQEEHPGEDHKEFI